jgi:hypothetical protein
MKHMNIFATILFIAITLFLSSCKIYKDSNGVAGGRRYPVYNKQVIEDGEYLDGDDSVRVIKQQSIPFEDIYDNYESYMYKKNQKNATRKKHLKSYGEHERYYTNAKKKTKEKSINKEDGPITSEVLGELSITNKKVSNNFNDTNLTPVQKKDNSNVNTNSANMNKFIQLSNPHKNKNHTDNTRPVSEASIVVSGSQIQQSNLGNKNKAPAPGVPSIPQPNSK